MTMNDFIGFFVFVGIVALGLAIYKACTVKPEGD